MTENKNGFIPFYYNILKILKRTYTIKSARQNSFEPEPKLGEVCGRPDWLMYTVPPEHSPARTTLGQNFIPQA